MKTIAVTDVAARQAAGDTYVDVRSTPEFNDGHPGGAIHVPLLEADEDTGVLMPNPDFVRVMKATFPPDTPLLLGCQSGRRSARATQMLEAFGFTNVTNVTGGYLDWQAQGLPIEKTTSGYDALVSRADD